MTNRFVQKLRRYVELSRDETDALEQVTARPVKFAARKDLIREGDQPGPMFVMLDGWAFRYKILPTGTRQITAFLMPGDTCDMHVGMLAAMDHSIQTATSAQVATITAEVRDELIMTFPQIGRAMYLAQLVDMGTLRAWITSLGRRSATERVAHLLVELYVREVRLGGVGRNDFTLPLSQLILADALGLTPVHLNRVLREFRESGAVQMQRNMLRIGDTRALIRHSGFDSNYLHRILNADQ